MPYTTHFALVFECNARRPWVPNDEAELKLFGIDDKFAFEHWCRRIDVLFVKRDFAPAVVQLADLQSVQWLTREEAIAAIEHCREYWRKSGTSSVTSLAYEVPPRRMVSTA